MSGEADQSFDDLTTSLLSATSNSGSVEEDGASSGVEGDPNSFNSDGSPDNQGDEPTGADVTGADEDASGDASGAEDGATVDDEPRYTVKVGGKEVTVTLKEALAGYQRNEDYTRKTQELADQRRTAETELQQYRANRERYDGILKTLQERLGTDAQEPTPEQWNALAAEEPDRYAVEWANFQRRQQQREAVQAERERIANEKRAEHHKALSAFVADQRAKLLDAMPEWKDKSGKPDLKKIETGLTAIREYAKSALGFSDQELDQAYDHRMLVMADKARRFDALMAERARVQQKLAAAPDMPAPGTRSPQKPKKEIDRAEAQKRFDRSGRVDDAVALILT